MGMYASSKMYERGLIWLTSNMTMLVINTTQAVSSSSALSDALAATSSGAGAGLALESSDMVMAAGDISGYKLTIASFANMQVTAAGSADHVTLIASSSAVLGYITTCNTKALTTTDTVTSPAWDIELRDPTSS